MIERDLSLSENPCLTHLGFSSFNFQYVNVFFPLMCFHVTGTKFCYLV